MHVFAYVFARVFVGEPFCRSMRKLNVKIRVPMFSYANLKRLLLLKSQTSIWDFCKFVFFSKCSNGFVDIIL